jgi:hypothetical protein
MPADFPVPAKTFSIPLISDGQPRLEWKIASYLAAGLGLGGVVAVSGAGTATGRYWIYHALTDTVIASITYADGTSSFLAGSTVKAGDRIYGDFTSITFTSGTGELTKAILLT